MMATFYSNYKKYLVPSGLLLLCLCDSFLSKALHINHGIITTAAEVTLVAILFFTLKHTTFKNTKILLIPAMIGVGDFFYGVSNYALRLEFANHAPCLIYLIPYLTALTLIIFALIRLSRNAESTQKGLLGIGLALSTGIFLFTTFTIIIPALFHKEPALDPFLKTLTIVFSILESLVTGLTLSLLLCSNCKPTQMALFGSLFMHVSDIALRYQSVRLDLMGAGVFEYGWCFGIFLAVLAGKALKESQEKGLADVLWLPIRSIRGMVIVFILTGFLGLWVSLGFYYQNIDQATPAVSTLLIVLGSFSFSVMVANFVTNHVTGIVYQIENKHTFKCAIDSPFIPYEIKVIASEFDRKNEEIKLEKDRVLDITSSVSHDLRSPLAAMKLIFPNMKSELLEGNSTHLETYLMTFESCIKNMQKTVNDLLNYRKEILEGDTIREAVENAANLAQISNPKTEIIVKNYGSMPGLRIHGLTRVLSNLLNNAVEASPEGKPVFVQVIDADDGVQITVKDEGSGIPQKVLKHIQLGRSITTKEKGNGLGLPFMVNWAKQEGISYEISSYPGKGTEIELKIRA